METTKFVGWFRPNPAAPWRPLVEGATSAEALNRLLDAVATGDKLVLPAGDSPDPPGPPPVVKRGGGRVPHAERD